MLLNYGYINQLSKKYYKNNASNTKEKIINFILLTLVSIFVNYFVYYPFVKNWAFCDKFIFKEIFESFLICVSMYYIINYIINR